MSNRKNQSLRKSDELTNKFYKESKDSYTGNLRDNVNWATSDEIKKLKRPTAKDYFDAIRERQTDSLSSEVITINENQMALNLIFRNGLNIRDMGNPMFGEENKTNKKNLTNNIILADAKRNKVCVIYGGDLLGEEWELKRLNNAKIIETTIDDSPYQELKGLENDLLNDSEKPKDNNANSVKKALFFALGERVNVLKRDILYTLKHTGVEVYLLNGAQEEKISKYFKKDVLETVVNDINNPRVHYLKGVNTIVNVEKKNKDGKSNFATIGLLTNNSLSKARKGQPAVTAVKLNSGENMADVVFVTNTNVAGKKGSKDYYVSGESMFIETPAKKNPAERPRGYNTFSLRIPASREITVIEGGNMPQVNPLEVIVYNEYIKNEAMRRTLERRAIDMLTSDYSLPSGKDPVRSIQQQMVRDRLVQKPKAEQQKAEEDSAVSMEV